MLSSELHCQTVLNLKLFSYEIPRLNYHYVHAESRRIYTAKPGGTCGLTVGVSPEGPDEMHLGIKPCVKSFWSSYMRVYPQSVNLLRSSYTFFFPSFSGHGPRGSAALCVGKLV